MTVVMVLHDVNQALRYSDNLVALAGGRIVAQGAPDDIITSGLLEEVYGVRLSVPRSKASRSCWRCSGGCAIGSP